MSKRSQRRDSFILTGLVPRAQEYARAVASRDKRLPGSRETIAQLVAQAYVDGVTAAFCVEDGAPLDPLPEVNNA